MASAEFMLDSVSSRGQVRCANFGRIERHSAKAFRIAVQFISLFSHALGLFVCRTRIHSAYLQNKRKQEKLLGMALCIISSLYIWYLYI